MNKTLRRFRKIGEGDNVVRRMHEMMKKKGLYQAQERQADENKEEKYTFSIIVNPFKNISEKGIKKFRSFLLCLESILTTVNFLPTDNL